MTKLQSIYKLFNPSYIPVHYPNRITALYHIVRYTVMPFTGITLLALAVIIVTSL